MIARTSSVRNHLSRRSARHGVAITEMVIVLPLIALIVFGAIDASNAISGRQSIHSAAYEGVRRAIRVDSSASDVNSFVTDFLGQMDITDFQLNITPPEPATATPGTPITVEITIDGREVALMSWSLVSSGEITARVVMNKE